MVDLLQGDHIGFHGGQHRNDTVRAAAAVKPEAFVDVIAGEAQVHVYQIGSLNDDLKWGVNLPTLFICLVKR